MKSMIDLMDWEKYFLLVPVVVQEEDGSVLDRAWVTRELLADALSTGKASLCDENRSPNTSFFIRSVLREETYDLAGIYVNCECDSLLYRVRAPKAKRTFRRNLWTPDLSHGIGAIAIDANNEVLMSAWMNDEAFEKTQKTGFAHYFSLSRKKLWKKGEESGHTQHVDEYAVSKDRKTVLLFVDEQRGGACHAGFHSCYFRKLEPNGGVTVIADRIFDPTQVYKK